MVVFAAYRADHNNRINRDDRRYLLIIAAGHPLPGRPRPRAAPAVPPADRPGAPRNRHTLFSVPMQFRGPLLGGGAVAATVSVIIG
ncbi:hypothetical protein GCM10010466_47370 [Planomonospora alba]|uniref:Uncharacterized protein n=1 Tax=Planomonospora alba TaxID=161354 RepID=A0ABP6NK27_9ACTN